MSNDVATLQSVQEKVKDRIQSVFMDLLPPELFEGMVQQHLKAFTEVDLPKLVKEAATAQLNAALKAEFAKPAWMEQWGLRPDGMGQHTSTAVLEIVKQAAPELVAAFFGGLVQQVVVSIRNGNMNRY